MARIAVIVSNPCTGDARVIKMARAAAAAGHEVNVFATAGPHAQPFEQVDGITYHRLEWRPSTIIGKAWPVSWLRRLSPALAGLTIRRLAPFLKYRLFSDLFAERIAAFKPEIVHAHDLICLPAGARACRLSGARLVYDAHELEVHRNPPLPPLQKWFVGRVERKFARRSDAVITVGNLVGQELARHIGRNDITVLFNSPPLEPSSRNVRSDLRLAEETRLIVYVGKVAEGRGVTDLLDLLPKLPGIFFATVGPCDARVRAKLESQANKLGVANRFRLLPPVPFEQVVSYIQGSDLGVISVEPVTLSYQYCMPNKLFELAFADVPILSNQLDEITSFLGELGNGEIVDFEDRASLPYIIFRMLQEKARFQMTAQARATLAQKYSWQSQSERLVALYARVMAG